MLTYEMKEPTLVDPLSVNDNPLLKVKKYDPEFEEFVVYNVKAKSPGNQISIDSWSIAIVIEGNPILIKEDDGKKVEMKKYSTWLLEPGKYIITIDKDMAEIYIASEKSS